MNIFKVKVSLDSNEALCNRCRREDYCPIEEKVEPCKLFKSKKTIFSFISEISVFNFKVKNN